MHLLPRKKILIVTHDVTQTGAPILLLNLMKIMVEMGYRFHCIIKNDFGSLKNEFESVAESCVIYNRTFKKSFINKFRRSIDIKQKKSAIKRLLSDVDLVISNTITNGDILPFIKQHTDVPVISYIHELKLSAETYTKEMYLQNVIHLSDLFLVPSNAVKVFLQESYSVINNKIYILNYFIPEMKGSTTSHNVISNQDKVSTSFIIGGMGTADWRKGPDIFIQVAKQFFIFQPDSDVQFIWKGVIGEGIAYKRLMHDIEKAGLKNKILMLQHSADVSSFFDLIHLFILTSREDPYPLVVLEAAANKVPTICFSDAGGAPEFIQSDAGAIVDYLDVVSMAGQILKYYSDNALLTNHGTAALRKVNSLHQDKKFIVAQLENIFKII